MFSFRWGGLDSIGDPQGYLGKQKSKDYANIISKTMLDTMVFHGPAQPTIFGSIRNTFTWRSFSISANISYKFGYYYRRPSVNYNSLFNNWTGNSDFTKRWQKPGDENMTNVPKMVYTNYSQFTNRDNFYLNSSVLVEKGDHIRLEDISVSYDIDKKKWHKLPFRLIRIYIYASNLGIIWRANKSGTDPYYLDVPSNGKAFSFGLNANF